MKWFDNWWVGQNAVVRFVTFLIVNLLVGPLAGPIGLLMWWTAACWFTVYLLVRS